MKLEELRAGLEAESGDGMELARSPADNPICSMFYDDTVPCICVVWKQYATSKQLRFIHEKLLELIASHGASKVLGDDTALPTIHQEDQNWILKNWLPRARAAGLKAGASKKPSAYFGRKSVEAIHSFKLEDVALRSFDDLAEGRAWLRDYRS